MKLFSLISVIVGVGLVLLMFLIYSPILDSPETDEKERILIATTFIFQFYLLGFAVYIAFKAGSFKKNENVQ